MPITLIFTCVFGITPEFSGLEKQKLIRISSKYFEKIRDEEGDSKKLELCFKVWGERADLAWYELTKALKELP
jgi:hypothetical protein